jgi:hypothetical protein
VCQTKFGGMELAIKRKRRQKRHLKSYKQYLKPVSTYKVVQTGEEVSENLSFSYFI